MDLLPIHAGKYLIAVFDQLDSLTIDPMQLQQLGQLKLLAVAVEVATAPLPYPPVILLPSKNAIINLPLVLNLFQDNFQ